MNSDKIERQWRQLAGRLKAKWGKLTDNDVDGVEGNREYLAGKLQEHYGFAKEEAHRQITEFDRSL